MSDDKHPEPPAISTDPGRRNLLRFGAPALAGAALLPWPDLLHAADSRTSLIKKLATQTGLDASYIKAAIDRAKFDPSVIKRIKTPYESRSYAEYRPLFVHQRLADKGTAYLNKHRVIFERAQKTYAVQPHIIAAILGMETRFGHYKGKDRVLDSLYTLATGYPRRTDFFRHELGEFLLLCFEEGKKPDSIMGSYAGAFGTTQFIPSSYRSYAVDADGDGHRDVWTSPEDIINSVAHYFHRHRWDDTRPVASWQDNLTPNNFAQAMLKDETQQWRPLGAVRKHVQLQISNIWQDDDRVALIERQTAKGKRIALVHYNFHVITRWNRSYNYAMAITELAHMLGCPLCKVES